MKNTIVKKHHSQDGQTLFEFVLLLLMILLISLSMLKLSNGGLGQLWQDAAKEIVNDPTQNTKLKI